MDQQALDIQFLRNRYAIARNKFRPRSLKVLFIAEAPPCDLDRYFYFEDVKKQDSLFLEIMGVLYPEQKKAYLASKRNTELKLELLQEFQADGYWLIDLSEVPHELTGKNPEASLPDLLERLKSIDTIETKIVLIKSNVFDSCYATLVNAGYRVSNERLPFPGSGQQAVFRTKFKRAIE